MKNLLSGKFPYLLSVFLIILLILSSTGKPVETDWRFDFTSSSQLPYGCEIIENNLKYVFPDKNVRISDRTIYETLQDSLNGPGVYLIVNDIFEPDEYDMKFLMEFIKRGGIVMVSSFKFSEEFQDSTGIHFTNRFYDYQWDSLKFEDESLNIPGGYQTSKHTHPIVTLNEDTDTTVHTVFARNDLNEPVFFSKSFGEGRLFVHLFPIGFTNYYLTEPDAADFGYKSLAFLPVDDVLWDEHYKTGKIMIKTPLRYILSEPHLAWAYYILLFSAVLFIFLHGKREQRIIPVIKPFINTSIEYYKRTALLRKYQDKGKPPVMLLYDTFSARVASHFRMSGNIFAEENTTLVRTVSSQAEALYRLIQKEFERILKAEKQKDEITSLILKIDNFYKLTGIYAKRRYRF